MDRNIHKPDPTPDPTFSVWLYPEMADKPSKFTGVVDVLKLPNGVVKIAHHDGVVAERAGEVIRLRQEDL